MSGFVVSNLRLEKSFAEFLKGLEASITKEAIDEWGEAEMLNTVRKNYWSNPDAKGLEEKR